MEKRTKETGTNKNQEAIKILTTQNSAKCHGKNGKASSQPLHFHNKQHLTFPHQQQPELILEMSQ